MPASLALDDYLAALNTAATQLRDDTAALRDEEVPTCRDWSTLQLIAHTGMVHRWATGIITGTINRHNADAATEWFHNEGMQQDDAGAWLLAGVELLTHALHDAPEDLEVFFFLNDAPPPRLAWARRQCHETTIHAVDGLAARLGRIPSAADAAVEPTVALDGIDELLTGFVTRSHQELRSPRPATVVVEPTDADRAWTLRLSDAPTSCEHGATVSSPDSKWTGTAAQLYLGLWNRGNEIRQDGDDVLAFWRNHQQIEWN
ncbi:hypothetical protein GCM10011492_33700 [Flexivirga endophytica]|uniref:Maleylpyruvate isomerase family mycothiol-dependent enzyme n=1 Tax=Flexivirga endophytica TaxID=1849103 RepID=A0A916WYD4_9MICO|nr:maleylpyruvate isomerase N-terminal domain-containing protein [Flexivirga endophytica]GGB40140.1 hypothetical protein GCM10011492_33700 [Flexivirga endophytica]GHB48011.1 hypothetical protein GCM10008112_16090 [Flexivirga endophytica]